MTSTPPDGPNPFEELWDQAVNGPHVFSLDQLKNLVYRVRDAVVSELKVGDPARVNVGTLGVEGGYEVWAMVGAGAVNRVVMIKLARQHIRYVVWEDGHHLEDGMKETIYNYDDPASLELTVTAMANLVDDTQAGVG